MVRGSYSIPTEREIRDFRTKIVSWFAQHKRDYPWRHTDDPVRVLIAEMMLRRTNADQVKRVYERVFEKYADVSSLYQANKAEYEALLSPLGLNWRTPAFTSVVRELKEKYNGKVPETRQELVSLPGVGDYVAGAVLSIAFGKPEWLVDSNVVRVFKRYFGMPTSKEGRRDRHVIETARSYARGPDPRSANLALLDFAALVCKQRKPHHDACPLTETCTSFRMLRKAS